MSHCPEELGHNQAFLSGEGQDLEGSITISFINEQDDIPALDGFEDSHRYGHAADQTSYYSGSPDLESVSPSSPFQGRFLTGLDGSSFHQDMASHYGLQQDLEDVDSSHFLLPGPRLQRRRSSSVESFQSFRSYISTSSTSSYDTPSSAFSTSMENFSIHSLDISEPKIELQLSHLGLDLTSSGTTCDPREESSIHNRHVSNTSSMHSDELSIKDMLQLLSDAGVSTASRDPEKIRLAFMQKLQLNAEDHRGNKSTKSAKMDIGTSATLAASKLRRKVEARFFCILCHAGFTRKNGLLNHYRSHLGIADKKCLYCHRNFTTSLSRHMKKCKSNPNRIDRVDRV